MELESTIWQERGEDFTRSFLQDGKEGIAAGGRREEMCTRSRKAHTLCP
jgi:hypothetical protein